MNTSIRSSHVWHRVNEKDLKFSIALFHSHVKRFHAGIPTFSIGNVQHMIRTCFLKNALPIVELTQIFLVEAYEACDDYTNHWVNSIRDIVAAFDVKIYVF